MSEFRPISVKLNLPMACDPDALAAEVRALEDHVRSSPGPYETKGWDGISLIQGVGLGPRSPMPSESGAVRAPALDRCPLLGDLLNGLGAPILVARLLYLQPGGSAATHRDPIGFPCGSIRIHLPIVTHPDVEMWMGGERMQWQRGELWYGDFAFPHRLANPTSDVTRVHLVIDVCITDTLLSLFPPEILPALLAGGVYKHRPVRPNVSDAALRRFEGQWHLPRSLLVAVPAPEDLSFAIRKGSVVARDAFVLDPIDERTLVIRGYYPGVTFEIEAEGGDLELVHRGRVTFDEGADPQSDRTPWCLFTSRSPLDRLPVQTTPSTSMQ